MHWFGGSIAEAVTLSKQKNAIFVVFVEGENDLSAEMAATIDDSAVVKRLSDESNFLAIKLKSGSTSYTHFAQIYQFVPVPSLFFIGRNGTPLEVVCAGVQPDNLATRIDRILEEHYKEKQPTVQPSTSSQHVKEETVNMLQSEAAASVPAASVPAPASVPIETRPAEKLDDYAQPETSSGPAPKIARTEHHEVTKSGQEYDVVCDGDVCVRKPRTQDEAGPSQRPEQMEVTTEPESAIGEAEISVEEKLERAKELIEARRKEKAAKEKELEKQKELERRNTGQGVAELKRWQAEQELKQIQEERKREKLENNLARQRILEQIAQDRAERRARDKPQPQPTQQPQNSNTSGDAASRSRIQFKLPDGTSHTTHFDADDTLGDVRRYVSDNLQLSSSSFSLWMAFPRRELTEDDATLRRLELAPSAALLVLPRRTAAVVARPSPFATIITFFTQLFTSLILEPSQALYSWLRGRPAAASPPPPSPREDSPGLRPSPGLRRRGNIHRLPADRSSDADNNTWNGNSTQQM